MRWFTSYRYLTRLNDPPTEAERRRVESYLGTLRLVIVLLGAAIYFVELPEPRRFHQPVIVLFVLYFLYSIALQVWVLNRTVSSSFRVWVQVGDSFWPLLISAFSHGPSSPFSSLYSFSILTAGFRWGFNEAMLVSICGALMVVGKTALLRNSVWGAYEGNRALIRCASFLALGYLVGIMGENEKERRAEADVISRVLQKIRAGRSLRTAFQVVFHEYSDLFGATTCFLAAHESTTDRVYLWRMAIAPQRAAYPTVSELLDADRVYYILPGCPDAFYCPDAAHPSEHVLLLDGECSGSHEANECHLQKLVPRGPVLSVSAPLSAEWTLRLIVAGAQLGPDSAGELTFARRMFQQASITLYGAYLLRRLRTRASAVERARVARELHDGVVQSLLAAEIRANVLRRRAEQEWPQAADEVASLENLLRTEARATRELMQQLRPLEVEPAQLLDHLANRVDRFRRDYGIAARFVSTESEVSLTAHACRELLFIMQEGLVNVRKHAHANNVLVSFNRVDGQWRLTISDDGVGFGFEGTLSGPAFMKSPRGPAILKERVANLGGELEVISSSHGSQLIIRLPQKGHFPHGPQ